MFRGWYLSCTLWLRNVKLGMCEKSFNVFFLMFFLLEASNREREREGQRERWRKREEWHPEHRLLDHETLKRSCSSLECEYLQAKGHQIKKTNPMHVCRTIIIFLTYTIVPKSYFWKLQIEQIITCTVSSFHLQKDKRFSWGQKWNNQIIIERAI